MCSPLRLYQNIEKKIRIIERFMSVNDITLAQFFLFFLTFNKSSSGFPQVFLTRLHYMKLLLEFVRDILEI